MGKSELSRRKVLASLTAAGSSGVVVGSWTGALFNDQEWFGDDAITASTSVAGVVNIAVDVDTRTSGTGVTYSITLPDRESNNSSYVWIRTSQCPSPDELAAAAAVELRIECHSGSTTERARLSEVLDRFRDGRLLCGGDSDPCLQPGETWELELEVHSIEDGYDGPPGPIEFELEFYGEQCRYNEEPESPFEDTIPACVTTGDRTPGISFVAFCSGEDSLSCDDIELEVTETKPGPEPIAVDWESTTPVDAAVLKAGQTLERFEFDAAETGSLRVGEGEPAEEVVSPSSPCPDGGGVKFDSFESDGESKRFRKPCEGVTDD